MGFFHQSRLQFFAVARAEIVDDLAALEIDFVAKTFENGTPYDLDPDFADAPEARDSLGANVNAFIASVLDGEPVAVPGIAGLRALDAARAVDGARTYGS